MIDRQHQKHGLGRRIDHVRRQAGKLLDIGHDARFGQAHALGYAGRAAGILEDRILIGIPVLRIQRHRRVVRRAALQRVSHGHIVDLQRAAHFLDVLQHEIHHRLLQRREKVGQRQADDGHNSGAHNGLLGHLREQA